MFKAAAWCVSSSFSFIKASSRSQLCVFDFFLTNSRGQRLLTRCLVSCVLWGDSLQLLVSAAYSNPAAPCLPEDVLLSHQELSDCLVGGKPVKSCVRTPHDSTPLISSCMMWCGVMDDSRVTATGPDRRTFRTRGSRKILFLQMTNISERKFSFY